MSKRKINKAIKLYADSKTEYEHFIFGADGKEITTSAIIYTKEDMGLISTKPHPSYDGPMNGDNIPLLGVYKQEFIDRLSPDNIDSQHFWKTATKHFPLFSIGGGNWKPTTIEEINAATFQMAVYHGVVDEVMWALAENPDLRILEIGPGHGGFKNFIANTPSGDENYYAIDVCPLFDHPRIYETDGKTIPSTIPYPCDIVYSFNVFQHLSKKQRTSYYRQIYEVLDWGGQFIFGNFVKTPKNANWPCWGAMNENGDYLVSFFKQMVVVDDIYSLTKELEDIGFHVKRLRPEIESQGRNYLAFKCTKIYE